LIQVKPLPSAARAWDAPVNSIGATLLLRNCEYRIPRQFRRPSSENDKSVEQDNSAQRIAQSPGYPPHPSFSAVLGWLLSPFGGHYNLRCIRRPILVSAFALMLWHGKRKDPTMLRVTMLDVMLKLPEAFYLPAKAGRDKIDNCHLSPAAGSLARLYSLYSRQGSNMVDA
jgi:hypothetical protein